MSYYQFLSFHLTGPVVAHRVVRGVVLLFHDHGTKSGWVVSSMPLSAS